MPAPPDPKFLLRGDMDERVHSLLFRINSDVEHLYAGDGSGTLHIWDLRKNRIVSQFTHDRSPPFNLHATDETDLIVQRRSGEIQVYNVNESSWTLVKSFSFTFYNYCRSQLSPEKQSIFIPLESSAVGMLSLKTFDIELTLDPSKLSFGNKLGQIMAIKPLTDVDGLVLVIYEVGKMLLWDIRKNEVVSSLKVEQYPMTFDFDTSLMKGILGSASEKLEIFEMAPDHTLSHKLTRELTDEHVTGISHLSIRPDKKIVAAGTWDGRIMLFSWKKLRPLAILNEHKDTVYDIIFSRRKVESYDTECLMAATGKDGVISMWDIYN